MHPDKHCPWRLLRHPKCQFEHQVVKQPRGAIMFFNFKFRIIRGVRQTFTHRKTRVQITIPGKRQPTQHQQRIEFKVVLIPPVFHDLPFPFHTQVVLIAGQIHTGSHSSNVRTGIIPVRQDVSQGVITGTPRIKTDKPVFGAHGLSTPAKQQQTHQQYIGND